MCFQEHPDFDTLSRIYHQGPTGINSMTHNFRNCIFYPDPSVASLAHPVEQTAAEALATHAGQQTLPAPPASRGLFVGLAHNCHSQLPTNTPADTPWMYARIDCLLECLARFNSISRLRAKMEPRKWCTPSGGKKILKMPL